MQWLDANPVIEEHFLPEGLGKDLAYLPLLSEAEEGDPVGIMATAWRIEDTVHVQNPKVLRRAEHAAHYTTVAPRSLVGEAFRNPERKTQDALRALAGFISADFGFVLRHSISWDHSLIEGRGVDMRELVLLPSCLMVVDSIHDHTGALEPEDIPARSLLMLQRPSSQHARLGMTRELELVREIYQRLSISDQDLKGRVGYRELLP